MRCPAKKWGLRGLLLLILFRGALPLHAQFLDICNKGTVTVEVVVATRLGMAVIVPYYWVIEGTPIAPGTCETVYQQPDPYTAYIGFGFADSQGQWSAGKGDPVPDLGTTRGLFGGDPILSKGAKTLCVHRDRTRYVLDVDNPETDCATLRIGGREDVGHGPFVPLAAVLHFHPNSWEYIKTAYDSSWVGGDNYLNIAPRPDDRNVHASRGTKSGDDAKDRRSPEQVKAEAELRKQVGEAIAREHAERERHERVVAEYDRENARVRSNVKSVADFSPDWMYKAVNVKGTVSRLEVQPMWVVVHFRESPTGAFVACFRRRLREEGEKGPIFEGSNGRDYSELLGKTVDVYGRVDRPACSPAAAGMDVRLTSQIKVY
jgi:hypothetical protein